MLALCWRVQARLECEEWPALLWSPVPKFIMCQAGHSLGVTPSGNRGGRGGPTGLTCRIDTHGVIPPKRAE